MYYLFCVVQFKCFWGFCCSVYNVYIVIFSCEFFFIKSILIVRCILFICLPCYYHIYLWLIKLLDEFSTTFSFQNGFLLGYFWSICLVLCLVSSQSFNAFSHDALISVWHLLKTLDTIGTHVLLKLIVSITNLSW